MKRKLIEVALPLDAINAASIAGKTVGARAHPQTLHRWWARRPLAAARAVLWASLVDDPTSHPDKFPTEEAQAAERHRLFGILEELISSENSRSDRVLADAHREIVESCDGDLPRVLDPFCGGGTIPLEAQRLGLETLAGDLNPIAVLITKSMIEVPPRFAGLPPVNPKSRAESGLKTWERAQGLAEDVRYYGDWLRDRAFERIGHLYPRVELPPRHGGGEATVIAWIWVRTVQSPDPSWEGHVPLVRSWVLRKAKKGKPVIWVEPVIDRETKTIAFEIREGGTPLDGTVNRGGGVCIATGTAMPFDYIREELSAGRHGETAIAAIVESPEARIVVAPGEPAGVTRPTGPRGEIFDWPGRTNVVRYGLETFASLFAARPLTTLETLVELLGEVQVAVTDDALASGWEDGSGTLRTGGRGATAYAEAVRTYLGFAISKSAEYWCSLSTWNSANFQVRNAFARQNLAMTWDFVEANPFSGAMASWDSMLSGVVSGITSLPLGPEGDVAQRDAETRVGEARPSVVSTDPPYYDNIPYADLSDFFYVWLRGAVKDIWPDEFSTVLTPKAEELIANRYRAGSVEAANAHFESGMAEVFTEVARAQDDRFPVTIFYAFKQSETEDEGTASTGWETFLGGLLGAGLSVDATWPVRTEKTDRLIASGTSALASSIVLSCRPRSVDAALASTAEFRAALRAELPEAIRVMQRGAIAPVDLAQSAIGPGMAVFSRYAKVVEADGEKMSVRRALQIINEVLDEVISEEETEFDADTRWAVTWYRQFGLNPGPYGTAETLSKAKNTSVDGVIEAGFAAKGDGKVWLLDRGDLQADWDPGKDARSTVWEATQHLVRRLESSEAEAAELRRQLGGTAERARQLAYLLYRVAEQKGWAKEAVAYNSLVVAWSELERLSHHTVAPGQLNLEA